MGGKQERGGAGAEVLIYADIYMTIIYRRLHMTSVVCVLTLSRFLNGIARVRRM